VRQRPTKSSSSFPQTIITTIAGTGVLGFSGDGGPAAQAQLSQPRGVAVGNDGSVYIADTSSNRIRKIDRFGTITTIAGTGVQGFSGDGGIPSFATFRDPRRLAVDANNNIYISDSGNRRVRKIFLKE